MFEQDENHKNKNDGTGDFVHLDLDDDLEENTKDKKENKVKDYSYFKLEYW